MAQINLEKILKKRSKLLLDFFFRVKGWSILVSFIIFTI